MRGNHKDTGKQVTQPGITIARFADGKIVEAWWSNDMLGVLQQFSVIPPLDSEGVRENAKKKLLTKGALSFI